jgi:hypothetical protein
MKNLKEASKKKFRMVFQNPGGNSRKGNSYERENIY